jgi:hypothetical protein
MMRPRDRAAKIQHLSFVVDDVNVDKEGESEADIAGAADISGEHACAWIRAFESSNQMKGSGLG